MAGFFLASAFFLRPSTTKTTTSTITTAAPAPASRRSILVWLELSCTGSAADEAGALLTDEAGSEAATKGIFSWVL